MQVVEAYIDLQEEPYRKLVLRTAYDEVFIDALKETIPYSDRQWDRDRKVWLVNPYYRDQVVELVEDHYDEVEYSDEAWCYLRRWSRGFRRIVLGMDPREARCVGE